MVSLFLIFRLLEGYQDNIGIELVASIILVALISPRAHALIFCRHGYGMLMGKRWSIVLRTFFWTSILLTALYSSFYNTIIWIFIIRHFYLQKRRLTIGFGRQFLGPLAGVCVGFGPMHQRLNQRRRVS